MWDISGVLSDKIAGSSSRNSSRNSQVKTPGLFKQHVLHWGGSKLQLCDSSILISETDVWNESIASGMSHGRIRRDSML